ncbi:hypothetical protein NDU88_000720 [Pleurodeles waltl]|uniref:L1 transposable element RRM domain-containing protein n=1 Tax=Pleurodeles waltl TaxID=8319 RepID=A0AAV7LX47_PLEWA|nr:hypothetical protein NDU88_000720 [Pleurodeles waltl]
MEDGLTPTTRSQNPTPQAKENMDKLETILKEIRDSRQAIENRLDTITTDMNIMKDDQAKLSDRLKQTESTVADILPTHNDNKNAIVKLQQQMEALQERIEDAEGCSQCNNIRIIGLPEGKEGNDPTRYIESWLQSIAKDRLSIHFVVERAHRIPGRKPIPGAPARPVIARILNYRDRDVARSHYNRQCQDLTISRLYPGSPETQSILPNNKTKTTQNGDKICTTIPSKTPHHT